MRPHIGHLRFYVGVLKMSIQSYTRKAKDSTHRLEKQECYKSVLRQQDPQNKLRGAKKWSSDQRNKVGKEKSRDH